MEELINRLNQARINITLVDGQLKLSAEKGSITEDLITEIKTNKEALVRYLKHGQQAGVVAKIHDGENYYELSLFQQEIWLNSELYQSNFYNQIRPFIIEGFLNIPAFERAAEDLLDRYEILRTTFHLIDGIPYQKIEARPALFDQVIDVISFDQEDDALEKALELVKSTGKGIYDLSKGPLIKFLLIRTGPNQYVFALLSHHIVMDGWSSELVTEFLISRYLFFSEGRPSDFEPLPFQYKDFAANQHQKLKAGLLGVHRDFWIRNLGGEIPPLNLPSDYSRPAVKSFRGDSIVRTLEGQVVETLKNYCKNSGITPFIFFQVLVKTLLYRYTGQKDLLIGTVFAGRESIMMEKQVGTFANILPVRTRINPSGSFNQLIHQVKEQVFEIYTHQFYPFSQILKDLALPFDQSHSPLFDVTVIVQNFLENNIQDINLGAIKVKSLDFETTLTTQDLSFIITEKAGSKIELAIFYNSDIFKKEKITALAQHLENLLATVLKDDSQPISKIDFLSDQERFELLHTFNNTSVGDPEYDSILNLFEEIATKYPEHIALVSNEHSLNYRELAEQTDNLAAFLHETYDVSPGDFVGVLTGRNQYTIIALLSVMKLGAIYMPVDEDLPEQRIREMCRLTAPKLMLITPDFALRLTSFYTGSIQVLDPAVLNKHPKTSRKKYKVQSADPAYIVFTSGSTGTPKPIVAKHEGLINNVCDYIPKLGVSPNDNYLQFFATGFDGFFFDIFPLLAGATLVMIDKETIKDKSRFLQYLDTHQVTITAMTPSYLDVLDRPELPTLRALISAGEAVDPQTAMHYAARKKFFNLYGPAETTVIASFYEVEPRKKYQTIPIGKPCANKILYVLDDDLNLLPKGVPGELCISGAGVVNGYFNAPAQTTEKFIPNPFLPGKTLYRTGDMAIWTTDGNLLFAGRKDSQVKVNGYRVELGEIEKTLLSHPEIAKTVVLAEEKGSGLIAFFQTERLDGSEPLATGTLSAISLREYLTHFVPAYMVPGRFIEINEWPVTTQGKIDQKQLLKIAENTGIETSYAPPANPTQEKILQIWKHLLRLDEIGIHDNFFQIGGDSLLAIRAISAIRSVFNQEFSVKDILYYPTIESIAEHIEKSPAKNTVLPPLQRRIRPEKIPLSYSQERLWVIDQLEGSIQYHIPTLLKLKNAPDKSLLSNAFFALIDRHETLRTIIRSDESHPYQVIMPSANWQLEYSEGESFSNPALLKAFIRQEISRPFDLSSDYMLRAHLVNCGNEEHVLILVIHHIASDGWSISLLVDDLAELYNAVQEGRPSTLPQLPIQYADYAIWQREFLSGDYLSDQLTWWEQHLQGIEPIQLPVDYPRPSVQSNRGSRYSYQIEKALADDLKTLSTTSGTTLFMTLITAFKVLLYRYSNQEDIVIGTPIANRGHQEIESLAGFFINTLVLRSDLSGNPKFKTLLERVKSGVLSSFAHQDVPFEQIVNRVEKNRSLSRNPLFQVEFVMQNTPELRELTLGNLRLSDELTEQETAQFDLSFSVVESAGGLEIGINYSLDIFSRSRIERMARHYENLLKAIVANPEKTIGQLPLLSAEEEAQILTVFNNTAVEYPRDKTFIGLFEDQVLQTPDHVAVRCWEAQLTYRELDDRANQLCHYLQGYGLTKEGIIGVCMDRSIPMLVSILAIFKAGGTYLPVDPDYPEDRIRYILEDSSAALVITDSSKADVVAQAGSFRLLLMDSNWAESLAAAPRAKAKVSPPDLAYVIYTSGSTGNPKGAQIEHRGMLNHLFAKVNELQITSESKVLQNASQSFDISIWQFLVALACGGTTVIYPQEIVMNPVQFLQGMQQDRLTIVEVVPSYLRLLLEEQKLWKVSLPDLQYLLVTGEVLPKQLITSWFAAFPDIPMVNAYGPTEASDDITHCLFRKTPESDLIPIGHTLQNLTIYIVSNQMSLCPVGVPGEIVVSGVGVGRGYLNNPAMTAEKFMPNPFNPQEQMYKTGDVGFWLENGDLAFIGRMDSQVKIRGHRIELGEIESTMQQAPGIRECVVLVREDKDHNKKLVAYAVIETTADRAGLQDYLQSKLPDYMVPSVVVELDHLPLTPNGKIDRKALPDPGETLFTKREFTAPVSEIEKELTRMWKEVLGKEKIGIHDNFFELGGDSIFAIQVVSRAKRTGLQLQPKDIFLSPTISALAKVAESHNRQLNLSEQGLLQGESGLAPIQASFLENEYPGMSHYNQSILLKIAKDIPESHLQATVKALVEYHDALRFSCHKEEGSWKLRYGQAEGQLNAVSLTSTSPESIALEITRHCERGQQSLCLEKGELFYAILIKTPAFEDANRLFIVVHHMAIDGISWRVLIENIESALLALKNGEAINFGPKGTSYRQWVDLLGKYAISHRAMAQRPYWESISGHYRALPVDAEVPVSFFSDIESIEASLNTRLTQSLLSEVNQVYHTEINDLLLAALTRTISRWSALNMVTIGLEGHGREDILMQVDISNSVGWFTSLYPVALAVEKNMDEGALIKSVKEQLRMIPEKGIGYGILRYLSPLPEVREKLSNSNWDLVFNYLGQLDNLVNANASVQMAVEEDGKSKSDDYPVKEKIAINAFISGGSLTLSWNYSNKQYHQKTIENLANQFITHLTELIQHCISMENQEFTPSDHGLSGDISYLELDHLNNMLTEQELIGDEILKF